MRGKAEPDSNGPPVQSFVRRSLDVIDDEHINRRRRWLQPQAKLFLHSSKDRRTGRLWICGRSEIENEIERPTEASLVDNDAVDITRDEVDQRRDRDAPRFDLLVPNMKLLRAAPWVGHVPIS